MMKHICTVLAILALVTSALSALKTEVRIKYTDGFRDSYSRKRKSEYEFPAGLTREEEREIASPEKSYTLTIQIARPKSGYNEATASIVIIGQSKQKCFIVTKNFRRIKVSWINDRLIYINRDIGHVAGIGEVFDVEEKRWLYQKGQTYIY